MDIFIYLLGHNISQTKFCSICSTFAIVWAAQNTENVYTLLFKIVQDCKNNARIGFLYWLWVQSNTDCEPVDVWAK